jgi:glycosyltransferase involved in cell wall biosynthesis
MRLTLPEVALPSSVFESRPSISVCLCSYRGSHFIEKQLRSIGEQTYPVNEVVIRDDASNDETVGIINRFRDLGRVPVRLIEGVINIGSNKNFENCIREATGEIVILSDQDDLWRRDKVEELVLPFSDPGIGLVFSNARMISEDDKLLPYTLWDAIRFTDVHQRWMRSSKAFEHLLRRFVVTGATMAFRRDLGLLAMPFPDGLVHDAWLALNITAISRCDLVDKTLIDYRQHSSQQIGQMKLSLIGQFLRARRRPEDLSGVYTAFEELERRLACLREQWAFPEIGELIRAKIEHVRFRRLLRQEHRIARVPYVLREWVRGRYGRFSNGWRSVAQDLFL